MNVGKELAALGRMSPKDLRAKYAEVFGEEARSGNKPWLVKRIAWRMQALEEGDLSERARRRAEELARDADLRLSPPKPKAVVVAAPLPHNGDTRLPLPGTLIQRDYRGQTLHVSVLATGFEYEGEVYKSLSAVAKKVTGTHCNGFHFFKLGKEVAK